MEKRDNQILHWEVTILLPRDSDWDTIANVWVDFMSAQASNWIFQIEDSGAVPEGETFNNPHIQSTFRLTSRIRKQHLLSIIYDYFLDHDIQIKNGINGVDASPTTKFNQDRLNWRYCSKEEGRILGPFSDPTFLSPEDFPALDRPWQKFLTSYLETTPDTREIINVIDVKGGTGKTTFQKYHLIKESGNSALLDFSGTVGQLVAAICNLGPKRQYFINLPWSMPPKIKGPDPYRHLRDLAQAIESTCDGLLSTSYFGSGKTLVFSSPHVIIFSNFDMDASVPGGLFAQDRITKVFIEDNGNFLIKNEKGHKSQALQYACDATIEEPGMNSYWVKQGDIGDAIEAITSMWVHDRQGQDEPVVTDEVADKSWPEDSVSIADFMEVDKTLSSQIFGESWWNDLDEKRRDYIKNFNPG